MGKTQGELALAEAALSILLRGEAVTAEQVALELEIGRRRAGRLATALVRVGVVEQDSSARRLRLRENGVGLGILREEREGLILLSGGIGEEPLHRQTVSLEVPLAPEMEQEAQREALRMLRDRLSACYSTLCLGWITEDSAHRPSIESMLDVRADEQALLKRALLSDGFGRCVLYLRIDGGIQAMLRVGDSLRETAPSIGKEERPDRMAAAVRGLIELVSPDCVIIEGRGWYRAEAKQLLRRLSQTLGAGSATRLWMPEDTTLSELGMRELLLHSLTERVAEEYRRLKAAEQEK